ncbi:phage tail protein [Halalkalibacter sp. AB-rgal2]|uniref:phage tail protein n=1 Tax=Halalkalibacter sp. AB-rgal2 TaxID=3242695 RepID=UPI00359CCD98
MAEPFLGEIRCFSFPFEPEGWAFCDGRTLMIIKNQALFTILGTTFGGNGSTTFCLPDLRGRVPVHRGTTIQLGEKGGEELHELTIAEMPQHTHRVLASSKMATTTQSEHHIWAQSDSQPFHHQAGGVMRDDALSSAGGSHPHSNMQPYCVANYCIAVSGYFPTRN